MVADSGEDLEKVFAVFGVLSRAALALWGMKGDPAPVGKETWRSVPRLNVNVWGGSFPICPKLQYSPLQLQFCKDTLITHAFLSIPECTSPTGQVSHSARAAQLHGWAPLP